MGSKVLGGGTQAPGPEPGMCPAGPPEGREAQGATRKC
jgi:hypothetical protein